MFSGIPPQRETKMTEKLKPTRTQPGEFVEDSEVRDEMVNDSLGTIDIADSTGTDEDKETGDAKARNRDTHED
jgi:hypothetical protein